MVELTYPLLADRVQDLSMEIFSSIGEEMGHNHSLQFGSTSDNHQIGGIMHGVRRIQLTKITALLAPVRLRPVPSASVEIKNMNTSGELLNFKLWLCLNIIKKRIVQKNEETI